MSTGGRAPRPYVFLSMNALDSESIYKRSRQFSRNEFIDDEAQEASHDEEEEDDGDDGGSFIDDRPLDQECVLIFFFFGPPRCSPCSRETIAWSRSASPTAQPAAETDVTPTSTAARGK